MLSERKEKDSSPKFTELSLAEMVEDKWVAIWHVTYCHKQNLSSKIQAYNTKVAWYAAFKPPYLPVDEKTFCEKAEVFNSNIQFTCGAKFSAFG